MEILRLQKQKQKKSQISKWNKTMTSAKDTEYLQKPYTGKQIKVWYNLRNFLTNKSSISSNVSWFIRMDSHFHHAKAIWYKIWTPNTLVPNLCLICWLISGNRIDHCVLELQYTLQTESHFLSKVIISDRNTSSWAIPKQNFKMERSRTIKT